MIHLPLALLVPLLAAAPPEGDPIAQALAERTEQALASASSPTGTAALLRLDELREYVSDAGALDRTLERVVRSPRADAFTRTSARLILLQSSRDRALVAVGGGSIIVPDGLPGVSEVIRPDHFDAANAIGAAIASVSGQVDRIFHMGTGGRTAALAEASEEAREHAVAAGADPVTVQIVEIEEIPLAYLTSPAVRIRAKAAGALGGLQEQRYEPPPVRQELSAGP